MSKPVPNQVADSSLDSDSAEVVPAEIEAALERLPPDQREVFGAIIEHNLSHSGPLPPPNQLIEYDHALPGLAERIVRLTEREQEHRHSSISEALRRTARLKERGQIMGMGALVLLLAFCIYLAAIGAVTTAGIVAVGTIAAVVGIFVTGRVLDSKAQRTSADEDEN